MVKILLIIEYFKRGHNSYFGFAISIFNFANISFVTLVSLNVFEPSIFSYILLLIIFFCTYIPLTILIGRWDYKKGSFLVLQNLVRERSPLYLELFERLERIEKKLEETNDT